MDVVKTMQQIDACRRKEMIYSMQLEMHKFKKMEKIEYKEIVKERAENLMILNQLVEKLSNMEPNKMGNYFHCQLLNSWSSLIWPFQTFSKHLGFQYHHRVCTIE